MRIFVIVAITAALTVALSWLPMPGLEWHVVRWAFYIPILLVGIRYGSFAGLFAGVTASLLFAFEAASQGIGGTSWPGIYSPDFAVVGFLGGRFLDVWPRFRQLTSARRADSRTEQPSQISEPEIDLDLNPLVSIESAAKLLAEEDTPVDLRQELAGIISKECQNLSASIGGLLQQVRAAAPPEARDADIAVIIDAALKEAEFVLCGRGIVLRKEIAPDLPSIRCNPDQIRNLFMSLTINAAQSVPAGTEVVLLAHRGADGVILDVRDQGRGSLAARIASLFLVSRHGVTSVGLAAAYDIVRNHGGTIEGKANVRKGLEFSVWLPQLRDCTNGGWQSAGGGGR